jgi:hypothetical protein
MCINRVNNMKDVCVFCGSYNGDRADYTEAARSIGMGLARRGLGVVYGGAKAGLMGTVAEAALGAGGRVIGVIPRALVDKELAHRGLTDLHVVNTMHERKAMMATISEGFIALPGGFGTMDELFEIITWAQLGLHRKPVAILNVSGFYDPLLHFLDHLVAEGFVKREHRQVIVVATDPDKLLGILDTYVPPLIEKWITKDDL